MDTEKNSLHCPYWRPELRQKGLLIVVGSNGINIQPIELGTYIRVN